MDLTPEDSKRVQEIREALEAEFRGNEESKREKTALKDIEDLKEDALIRLRKVVKHTDNESLAAKVSMWVVDAIIESEKTTDDPMTEMLKGIEAVASVRDK